MTKGLISPKAIMAKRYQRSKLLVILSLSGIERKKAFINSVTMYKVPESILTSFRDAITSNPPVGIGATAWLILL